MIEKRISRLRATSAALRAAPAREFAPAIHNTPALPAVNWGAVNQQAPQLLATPLTLPVAAVIIITWAEAEWSALEHVFCNSAADMPYGDSSTSSWGGWQKYTQNLPSVSGWSYWGEYRLVQIGGAKVLLFKSNTHLDYPGEQYLEQLITQLIGAVKPQLILSIGTAGGTRLTDHVGTVNVVNGGTLYDKSEPAAEWIAYTNKWQPDWSLIQQPGFAKLLFPVPTTASDLASIGSQFNAFYSVNYPLATLNPGNLNQGDALPAINNLAADGTNLLTASTFVVGTTSGSLDGFACVEMDDAIIAKICAGKNTPFGFVRNISDPAQNATLPTKVQGNWGSAIYTTYGLYTSYNGAVAAWALVCAQFGSSKNVSQPKNQIKT